MGLNFLIEKPLTPTYQRINQALVNALLNFGHQVNYINPLEFKTEQEYLNNIKETKIDFCVINSSSNILLSHSEKLGGFVFEFNECKNIFICYENLGCFVPGKSLATKAVDINFFKLYLSAFLRRKNYDYYFVIEYSNFLELRKLGINKCFLINHASDYKYIDPPHNYKYSVSFVGHILPPNNHEIGDLSHLLLADLYNRINNLDHKIEKSACKFSQINYGCENADYLDFLSKKYFYILQLHCAKSLKFRGEFIKIIKDIPLTIVGGAPGYLHNLKIDQDKYLEQDNITYHPPTADYEQTAQIYAQSQINLNITSLQFDSAVINRVVDVAAVGGFILTDWKPDLSKLTSVANQISYRTVEELNYKLHYYLHADHQRERLDIAHTLHEDLKKRCSYSKVAETILSKITSMTLENNNYKIDLGCGKHKPEGFIGVDIYEGPKIDIVADLNQSFPFPDNYAQYIRAHDIIEHLPNQINTMNEIWRIGQDKAIVDIRVPSTDGRGAFQDPTHVSFWNINSFKYYCVEFPAYWELAKTYGFKGGFHLLSLNHENKEYDSEGVIHVIAVLQVIKNIEEKAFLAKFNLKKNNWVVFPDWQKEEELLFEDLAKVIQTFFDHPNQKDISLLICRGNLEEEDVNEYIVYIVTNLALEKAIEFTDEDDVAINLISDLTTREWEILLPYVSELVSLNSSKENQLRQGILKNVSIR